MDNLPKKTSTKFARAFLLLGILFVFSSFVLSTWFYHPSFELFYPVMFIVGIIGVIYGSVKVAKIDNGKIWIVIISLGIQIATSIPFFLGGIFSALLGFLNCSWTIIYFGIVYIVIFIVGLLYCSIFVPRIGWKRIIIYEVITAIVLGFITGIIFGFPVGC